MTGPALERLWAGWRSNYVASTAEIPPETPGESVFEQILHSGLADDETYIVHRGAEVFAILNLYPYSTGHVLVLPNRAVASLGGLTAAESAELFETVRTAVATLEVVYRPDGMNVGMNLGRSGGAGIPDHLHMHCLPRWAGDTNFMTSVAEARVLPEPLDETWRKVVDNWQSAEGG